jgi:hypothetical protein
MIEKVDEKKDLWVMRQGIGVDALINNFSKATNSKKQIGFVRYFFLPSTSLKLGLKKNQWDREIIIKEKTLGSGYVISFPKIPDFDKRRSVL